MNVLIGPNGSGKSNLIEALELLKATPKAFAAAIRDGGGAREWLWKGDGAKGGALIEARLSGTPSKQDLRYRLAFTASGQRTEVIDEVIEDAERRHAGADDVDFYYRFQGGNPVINVREPTRGSRTSDSETPGTAKSLARRIRAFATQRPGSLSGADLGWPEF